MANKASGRISGRAQLAIGIAAMAATVAALQPARGQAPLRDERPASGYFSGAKQDAGVRDSAAREAKAKV